MTDEQQIVCPLCGEVEMHRCAEAALPPPALDATMREHRKCGPKYEGCYSHFVWMDHCRADGMAWPCDVDAIRGALGLQEDVRSPCCADEARRFLAPEGGTGPDGLIESLDREIERLEGVGTLTGHDMAWSLRQMLEGVRR